MGAVVLDTGALVGLEERSQRAKALWKLLDELDEVAVVPAAVLAEWWRGGTWIRHKILKAVHVEPVTCQDALEAGEALAKCGARPSCTDALVVVVAARLDAAVFTGDKTDLDAVNNATGDRISVHALP